MNSRRLLPRRRSTSRRTSRPAGGPGLATGPAPYPAPGSAPTTPDSSPAVRPLVAVLLVVGLLATGCTAGTSAAGQTTVTALPAATPKALSPYYHQKLHWHRCATSGFDCTTMKVPLDHERPEEGDIKLAVARRKATGPGRRIGSLLVNPGGPGASAVGYLQAYAGLGYPAGIRARYDLVAVDPRGVAQSTPVVCLEGKRMDAFTQIDTTPDDERERDRLTAAHAAFGAACAEHSARILPHVSTVEAARDMDMLRAALGDRRLHYVGASYGTFLGATYAGLYPERVGRLVLDGGMDPRLSARRMNLEQTAGFERAFRAFARDCAQHSDCPLLPADPSGTDGRPRRPDASPAHEPRPAHSAHSAHSVHSVHAAAPAARTDDGSHRPGSTPAEMGARLRSFFRHLDRNPLPARAQAPGSPGGAGHRGASAPGHPSERDRAAQDGPAQAPGAGTGRRLGEALATTGVIAAMYDERAWPELRAALTSAMEHRDGSGLLAFSDLYYQRAADGRYANLMAANAAVNCLDLPPAFTTERQVRQALPAFRKASPVFGEGLAWASLSCAHWPVHATGRAHAITAEGAPSIVVVGTLRDPATPYPWARALAAQLDSGRLLTYDGDGHTAYGRGSRCVDTAINTYLLTGTAPKDGKRCS